MTESPRKTTMPPTDPLTTEEMPGPSDYWYVEARIGSENTRGEALRVIIDRRGREGITRQYVNIEAQEYIARLLATLDAARSTATPDRDDIIEGLSRAYDIVKPEPGMDGPHGGHIGGPSREKAAIAIENALQYLAGSGPEAGLREAVLAEVRQAVEAQYPDDGTPRSIVSNQSRVHRRAMLALLKRLAATPTASPTDPEVSHLDLPSRVVVDAHGHYWRDYGTYWSMCSVSDENHSTAPVAIYVRAKWSEAMRGEVLAELAASPTATGTRDR